jgi:hypothetical protein
MRKTNIRINGYFLARNKNQYHITKINNYQKWIDVEDISEYVTDNVTSKYTDLSDKYSIKHNVNFLFDEQSGG